MSFQDLIHGRGEQSNGAGNQAQEARLIEGQVFKLASSLSQLKKLVDALGTPKDTVDHRHKLSELNGTIQQLAKSVKERLTALHAQDNTPEQQLKAKKLLQDFANILLDYKSTQKIAQERESSCLPRPNPIAPGVRGRPTGAPGAASAVQPDMEQGVGSQREEELEKQALLQQQKQVEAAQLNNAIAFNESLIEERDQGIAEIARQIGEVNEMFQDLAVLINDQGVQVQTIDEHITATAERVKEGGRELVKAERSGRAMRNKCLCIWLVAAVIVSIVIILVAA